jgi:class 3 adenylate cyclase
LVKTIGDKVMTIFPDAATAAEAAQEMREGITGRMVVEGSDLTIRVGFHFGPTRRACTRGSITAMGGSC